MFSSIYHSVTVLSQQRGIPTSSSWGELDADASVRYAGERDAGERDAGERYAGEIGRSIAIEYHTRVLTPRMERWIEEIEARDRDARERLRLR